MRHTSRFCFILAIAGALSALAACSKSVAPIADPPNPSASDAASGLQAYASADTATLLRLTFDTHLARDDRGRARRPRQHPFYFTVPAAPTSYPTRDTIPAHSTLIRVEWWRRDTTGWSVIPMPVESVQLSTAAPGSTTADMPAGVHRLVVRRPAALGSGSIRFHVYIGLIPRSWWAGPDPFRWPRSPDGDGRSVEIRDWSTFENTAGRWPPDRRGWFGPDSFAYRPADRLPLDRAGERRTFWEIRGNRIWARSDGDTVRLGSALVFSHGGSDEDSPYRPHTVAPDPVLPPGWQSGSPAFALLDTAGVVGSAVAMRITFMARTPAGSPITFPETTSYPWFDVGSAFRQPQVHAHFRPVYAGKHYIFARAEDGDGQLEYTYHRYTDGMLQDAVDRVDAGGGSGNDRILRQKVLTFFVRP